MKEHPSQQVPEALAGSPLCSLLRYFVVYGFCFLTPKSHAQVLFHMSSFKLLLAACLLSAACAITPEIDGHVVEVRAARPRAPDVRTVGGSVRVRAELVPGRARP